ncbi:glycosyl hydrolase [Clostridia bacterium]|nr:glycosyl hydrolase [Clostridia bacterium]
MHKTQSSSNFVSPKKLIGISIPCRNEEDNVIPLTKAIIDIFAEKLPEYDVRIQFIDNFSTDKTRDRIREICKIYSNTRAIFNAKNYPTTSGYYGLLEAGGDCTIAIPSDFQVPVDLIPEMVKAWEGGAKVVRLIKVSSSENGFMRSIRQLYYKIVNRFSDTKIVRNFTGSGLYDKEFIEFCHKADDAIPSLSRIISTFAKNITDLEYHEERRKYGKSNQSFSDLLSTGILRYTNASSVGPRYAMFAGVIFAIICFVLGIVYLILKFLFWDMFPAGTAPILIGMFFMGSIQLFFIGLIGEYVVKTNLRLMKQPLVVEEERINFEESNQ